MYYRPLWRHATTAAQAEIEQKVTYTLVKTGLRRPSSRRPIYKQAKAEYAKLQ